MDPESCLIVILICKENRLIAPFRLFFSKVLGLPTDSFNLQTACQQTRFIRPYSEPFHSSPHPQATSI